MHPKQKPFETLSRNTAALLTPTTSMRIIPQHLSLASVVVSVMRAICALAGARKSKAGAPKQYLRRWCVYLI
jgi:hypothetical protein